MDGGGNRYGRGSGKRARSKTWLADTLRGWMPKREEMARNKYLAPIAHRFLTPELWRFTRRSVPRGVALGLFCAFIIPLGQIFLAAFLALPARANVPISALTTFVTNPLTFPFWAFVANRTGALVLRIDTQVGGAVTQQVESESFRTYSAFFETAGLTVFGFVVLAVVTAALGYVISGWVWRRRVRRRRNRRLAAMAARTDARIEASAS